MYRTIDLAPSPSPDATVAIALFESGSAPATLPPAYADVDRAAGGALSRLLGRAEFKPAKGAVLTAYPHQGPERVYVIGLGDREKFTAEVLRAGVGRLVRAANAAKVTRLRIVLGDVLHGLLDAEQVGHAIADGLGLAGFTFETYKGAVGKDPSKPANGGGDSELQVEVEDPLRDAVARGLTVARATNTARRLAATPPNVANPRYIADECRRIASEVGLTCRVIERDEAQRLGMGGLLAVGRGGNEPPRLIVLEWSPESADVGRGARDAGPILLVGKTITFDTGGYSIKPAASMASMKYDKCGGMAVIGAMEAIARLKLPRRVVALLPTAENMIDENAFRVDDILTFANGVTCEITNTDAEGRLVLADALAYGTKEYQPSAVLDLATLTGGVIVALGSFAAGYFCNDEGLRSKLQAASDFTGERLWELPLWDDHRDMMKGQHADLVNSSERKAHPIQGAAFLSYFVGESAPRAMPTLPWAHLDIAGVVKTDTETPLYVPGATGWGVRLLVRLVSEW